MRCGEGNAADNDALQAVRGTDRDRARRRLAGIPGAGQPLLVDRCLARCSAIAIDRDDARDGVGVTVDGDGERRRAGIAVGVGNCVGVGLGQALPCLQRIDRRIGVVQGVGVAAVSTKHQRAVGTIHAAADVATGARRRTVGDAGHRRGVGTKRVAARAGDDDVAACAVGRGVFADGVDVGDGERRGVENVDGQGAGVAVASQIVNRQGDGVVTRCRTRLIDWAVEGIGIA